MSDERLTATVVVVGSTVRVRFFLPSELGARRAIVATHGVANQDADAAVEKAEEIKAALVLLGIDPEQ